MAIFTTALAVAGGAKVLTGLAGGTNRAQGMLDSGRDTLLTARSNINQRKLEAQQVQFQILESGHQAASRIQREARKAEGAAKATGGSSGAVLDGGTPQQVLSNIVQEGLVAQKDVILDARQRMKSVRRDTENQNKSEWKEAKDYKKRMSEDAKKTIANSRMQAVADIAETAASVYSAGTAGGTKAFSWGSDVAKGVKVASDAQSATGGTKGSSLTKSPYDQRGYKPTDWDRAKYQVRKRDFDWSAFKSGKWGSMFDYKSNKKTYK